MWPYTAEEADALAEPARPAGAWLPGPRGELASRALAMPADTNPLGTVFGGWIMAQMDAAGAMAARRHVPGPVATVAVTNMTFYRPVRVGDSVSCYAELVRIGRTSIVFHIEAWVLRSGNGHGTKVTEAEFTFVAIDENGEPVAIGRTDPGASRSHGPRVGDGAPRAGER